MLIGLNRVDKPVSRGPHAKVGAWAFVALSVCTLSSAHGEESVDWPAYGGASGGGHYSNATQIDADNVGALQVAWTHRSGDFRTGPIRGVEGFDAKQMPASAFIGTPILVNDTLYYCTPFNRVFALDPQSGAERWVYDPQVDMSDEHLTNCRAVSSWVDPSAEDPTAHCAHRIIVGTLDGRVVALDGASGKPCRDFGTNGELDLTVGLSEHDAGEYGITSAPAILNDLLITGAYVEDSIRKRVPSGVVRAYSVRTGTFRWGWNPVPPGMPAQDEAGTYASGLVFIAASADRHIRAFDIETGEERWADELPTTGNAVPMTYISGGRQFVVIAAGGHFTSPSPPGDYLIAYALPSG